MSYLIKNYQCVHQKHTEVVFYVYYFHIYHKIQTYIPNKHTNIVLTTKNKCSILITKETQN